MARRFDTLAPDPLALGAQAFGRSFELGVKQAQSREQFKAQMTQKEKEFGAQQRQQGIANKRADKSLAIQEGYLSLSKQKHKLGMAKYLTDAKKATEKDRFAALKYQLDDAEIETGIREQDFKYNSAFSEIGRREQLKNMRQLQLEEGWKNNIDGRSAIITGFDPVSRKPSYMLDEKGNIKYVTQDEYSKMRASPEWQDDIDSPISPEQDVSGNPFLFMKTNELKAAMAEAETAREKLNLTRVERMMKEVESRGIEPNEEILIKGLPRATTVDSITQFPDVKQLFGLSASQKASLMEDIEAMGAQAAMQMARDQGGAKHEQWMAEFIRTQTMAPSRDMRSTINQSLLRNPKEAMRLLGESRADADVITGQPVYTPETPKGMQERQQLISSLSDTARDWYLNADKEEQTFIDSITSLDLKREYIEGQMQSEYVKREGPQLPSSSYEQVYGR